MKQMIRDSALPFAFVSLIGSGVPVVVAAADSGVLVEEIIVTAQKREERAQDVPVPVTSLPASALIDSNQLEVKDYYTSVPGLNVIPGNLGATAVIRGLAPSSGNPTVGIVVDDLLYGASTRLGAGGVVPDFDPGDLARIEVLRGPQGTLYGANSLGGLLKYVTVDPSADAFQGRIQLGGTQIATGDGAAGYSARASVNVPLGDTFAFRLSGFTRSDPGYIDNVQTGEEDVNRTDSSGGRLSALWRPSDVFSLRFSAMLQHNEIDGFPYAHSNLGDLQQSTLRGTGKFKLDSEVYSLLAQARLGEADLTAISGYSVFESQGYNDFSYAFSAPTQAQFGVAGAALDNPSTANKFSEEVRLAMPIGSRLDWLIGAFYTRERSELDTQLTAVDPNTGTAVGQWLYQPIYTHYEEYAGFTDLTVHFTDRFDTQFGLRDSEIRQEYESYYTGPYVTNILRKEDPLVPPVQDTRDSALTYLVTPRLKVSDDLMLYARFASGYRPGGPNSNNSVNPVPAYDPDQTQNYEIGMKGNALGGALSFDASVYYIDWKDIQLLVVDPVTRAAIFINAGRAKSQGVELSAELRPTSTLTASLSLTFSDAVLRQDLPSGLAGTAVGFSGDRLPANSRFSAHLALRQDFALSGAASAFIEASESYVGERLGNFAPTVAARQVFPAYFQTDLRGGFEYETWSATLFVNNVTDRRGLLPSSSTDPRALYPIQPRTLGVNVSKAF